ncbi:dTDP-4-dehydrorhamnose reductase [Paenibacillus sp. J2TS4]|uniref:dTDP-4-dehydrorhamnose reductase n=1 Tax=Paenibacillus sp. J2TS4 TaxID=2807194 RepID=UPI001AFEA323|nr:dTDP-4-dehydrorhamnose reductase [Paenibacillus sp. J2TS4]GIP35112.1 NAD(P)-dependent oxidoreductase [Paenibacillus sp. J2TS4]
MKVIVTGAQGQLGKDLCNILDKQFKIYGLGRLELDVTVQEQCEKVISLIKPDVIIHSAAFTDVDRAEVEETKAYLVNAYGSRNIAVAAEKIGAKVCYISTDYVFDGNSTKPYREFDNTNPICIYGKSKRAGELFIQTFSSKYFIVRTSWVYGMNGNNFVKSILKQALSKQHLKVVNDQTGSPTYTIDLSKFIAELILSEKYGIYHVSNSGACSWFDFAQVILQELGIDVGIDPCTSKEFTREAPRPTFSVLEPLAIRANGFKELRHWRVALSEFIREFKDSNHEKS